MNRKGFGRKLSWYNGVLLRYLPEGIEENHENVRISGVPAENETDHLPNTILESYRRANPLGGCAACTVNRPVTEWCRNMEGRDLALNLKIIFKCILRK
jgi:hypothetical protein